ncbi:Crp/Fnr family transcriptional regulator [Mesorhizobium sp. J18]|uniref:Crp/Fnr family transcriptional regulator n=1 Tax=Mesorhizobium sp. J18 TaxID=935263 RepID=UPI0011A5A187|nr:Crp/Fnr family transcriptional regulator [Mesorhizobium sp. J18]
MKSGSDAFSRKLGTYLPLDADELGILQRLANPRTIFSAGREIAQEGQNDHAAYILHDGWACSYKRLHDGGRQVINIQIPGDFLGLRSLLLRSSDQNLVALTPVEVSQVYPERLLEMFSTAPRLAMAWLWAASRDEAMIVEHLVSLGRRDALARTAHFFLELGARMKLIERGTADGYACPLSQSMLADALGITAIHLNRVLRQLRESGLLVFRDSTVTFLDRKRLAEIADFDLSYLDHGTAAKD